MVKTTINLDTSVYRALVREAIERYGTTKRLSMLINEKLKKLSKKPVNEDDIVKQTFGMWKIKETGLEYTTRLRQESERRLKEILHEDE